ncbi:hypothetical protein AADG42_03185 [Ammonicoccus fulvus]|uniref:Rhodanese domain-containing protein n=1 Tax=Ammonicoccus fulvus TaxID=3138240 RepID=A0ABZ3FMG3_9ACTN
MELHAEGGSDAEGLMRVRRSAGELRRTRGQLRHDIGMRRREQRAAQRSDAPQHGITLCPGQPLDPHRTMLPTARISNAHLATKGLGQQLMPQADPEQGNLPIDGLDPHPFDRAHPEFAVIDTRSPAEHDDSMAQVIDLRQRLSINGHILQHDTL